MKIGILTHYNVNNQGAQLQMYAMSQWLEDHGHEVVILTYQKNFDFDKLEAQKNSGSFLNFPYYVKNYLFDRGIGLTLFNTRKVLTHKRAFKRFDTEPYNRDDLDAIIIGSDEVFSIDVGCNKMMYGYGLKAPAIAYAPAFGRTTEEELKKHEVHSLIRQGLSHMYRLSARDTHTQEMIRSMTGREVPLVCDPVLLYDGSSFKVPVKPIKKKYMLVYSYDRNMVDPGEIRAIKAYAKKHRLITVSLGTYHKWCDKNIVCNAEEWYSFFSNAECVLTDTFHGSIVAIKNHCMAAFFIRESINAFKMRSLLEVAGLEAYRLEELSLQNLERVLAQTINYEEVDYRINNIAKSSEEYLLNAIDDLKKGRESEIEKYKNIKCPSKYPCSGCGACNAICPQEAIKLGLNKKGFYEAIIHEDICINCGKCIQVCPRYGQEKLDQSNAGNLYEHSVYALQSKDRSVVRRCSSGGFAHEASLWALDHGYKVVGAVYNYKNNNVEHQIITEKKDITKLDGSKYLQSDTNVFKEVVRDARRSEHNRYFIIGTPCQITGLVKVADSEKIRDQFIFIDIFCHGVPSYKLWEEELCRVKKKIGNSQFTDVQFRYKKDDWHNYCLRIDTNRKTFYGSREKELFYQVYFENILLNNSCIKCEMRKTHTFSDLRIGDYWGKRYQDRSDGVSAVFACSNRGDKLVKELLAGNRICRVGPADAMDILKYQNMEGYHQTELHDKAMNILSETDDIMKAIAYYHRKMPRKQQLKLALLKISTLIPGKYRIKIKNSIKSILGQ